mgnify:CR=1 FL=1
MKSVRPKKDFLVNTFIYALPTAQAIADTVDACPDIPVLEVGPGMGVMTQYLVTKDRELKVVESTLKAWLTFANIFLRSKIRLSKTIF